MDFMIPYLSHVKLNYDHVCNTNVEELDGSVSALQRSWKLSNFGQHWMGDQKFFILSSSVFQKVR
jgi:hypothetical protein